MPAADRSRPRPRGAVCALLVLPAFLAGAVAAGPPSLADLAARLRLDPESVTVSGISSGAFMAQQFHVAHSKRVRGAAMIAGGPYRCAEGRYPPYTWLDLTGLYTATSVCSDSNPWWFYQGPPDADFSVAETRRAAASGAVDDPSGLRGDRVWLLSGSEDHTVPRGVVDALHAYYSAFVDDADLHYERLEGAGHAMLTDDFGNACEVSDAPYISDCDFDAAGRLLGHLLGRLAPPAADTPAAALHAFDQSAFVDPAGDAAGMHASAWVYAPSACLDGATCRLHVAFHGCRQHPDAIGDTFARHAGYNEWAESNGIVVLYPQAKAIEGPIPGTGRNPRGCWDWWGYSGDDYAAKGGVQIRAVAAMIDVLLGDGAGTRRLRGRGGRPARGLSGRGHGDRAGALAATR
jgi:poly(3-hydroxybutyrate) depolymerase